MEHPNGIPGPDQFWGDWRPKQWSFHETGLFGIWVWGVASALVFAEQDTINRVQPYVQSVIDRAKAGELNHKEAIELVRPSTVFSEEERAVIHENAKKHGQMMGDFFSKPRKDIPIN